MAARSAGQGVMKKAIQKVTHKPFLKTNIPAGMASAAPPLGPQLGQRGIQIAAFCKEFNERTANIKKGIPLPTRVQLFPDRSFEIKIHNPPLSYFLKQAAGIKKGAAKTQQESAGKVTLKHIYEIATIKHQDPPLQHLSLQEVCKLIIGSAHSCGIDIVRELDPDDYSEFLSERAVILAQQAEELEEVRKAKMLRL